MKNPQHIAFIMDGNRRWAKKSNCSLYEGHYKGMEKTFELITYAYQSKIPYLSFFCFSTDNWKREQKEIDNILRLMYIATKKSKDLLSSFQINLKILGDLSPFPKNLRETIKKLEENSKNYSRLKISFALNYSSHTDIIKAVKIMIKKNIKINETSLGNYLSTNTYPDPDILIRTSGEKRLSNFLLWELSYTELFFLNSYWPDFSIKNLEQVIDEFKQRKRRYGK